jgi:hypothetical protein
MEEVIRDRSQQSKKQPKTKTRSYGKEASVNHTGGCARLKSKGFTLFVKRSIVS